MRHITHGYICLIRKNNCSNSTLEIIEFLIMKDIYKLISEGKIKRFFQVRNKLSYPGLVSHITQRATGKEPLFLEEGDYLYLLKLLKEISSKFSFEVFAFALMTNHVHILIRQKEDNLAEAMHNLFARYAHYFNYKYGRKGHVFGNRYSQAACFDDYYLLAISIYIHLNPVRAGMVDHYYHYPWTTWRLYCRQGEIQSFVNWRFIIGLIDADIEIARTQYKKLMNKSFQFRFREVLENKKNIGRLEIWIRKNFPDIITNPTEQNLEEGGYEIYLDQLDVSQMINKLKDRKRLTSSMDIKARNFVAGQLKARGYSPIEIADYMGISRATVYRALSEKE